MFELFLHWNCFILHQSLNSIQKWEIDPLLLKLALRNRPFISRPLALNWPPSHGLYMSVCMCQPNVPLISFIHVLCFKMVGSLPLSGLAHLFRTCPTIRKWAWPCPCKPKTGLMGKYVYAKKGPGIFLTMTAEKLLALLSRPQRHFLLVHVLVWKVYECVCVLPKKCISLYWATVFGRLFDNNWLFQMKGSCCIKSTDSNLAV